MKSIIRSLQGEKWDILPNGFLTQESLAKLQRGVNDMQKIAQEYFSKPEVKAKLAAKFGKSPAKTEK